MKPSNFTNFLDSGALLRVSSEDWFLLMGPFHEATKPPLDKPALFQPDFFMESSLNYWIPESFYRLTTQELKTLVYDIPTPKLSALTWQDADFEGFKRSFDAIVERLRQGNLEKAVPIVFEKSTEPISSSRLAAMLKELLQAPPNLYVFGIWQNGQGILGATPEVLLKQEGRILKTMALAGTCPKEEVTLRKSLLDDPKERHEHDFVVKDILERLASYGSVKIQGPKVLELPTLFHLQSEIQCQLTENKDFSFFDACRALHPTPALGVSPRSYGFHWMRELPEQKNRRGFGAPWGLSWSADEALCLVAIRNIQWDSKGSRIGSGCGIVAQSDLQQEWRELWQKRNSVKKILGLDS